MSVLIVASLEDDRCTVVCMVVFAEAERELPDAVDVEVELVEKDRLSLEVEGDEIVASDFDEFEVVVVNVASCNGTELLHSLVIESSIWEKSKNFFNVLHFGLQVISLKRATSSELRLLLP